MFVSDFRLARILWSCGYNGCNWLNHSMNKSQKTSSSAATGLSKTDKMMFWTQSGKAGGPSAVIGKLLGTDVEVDLSECKNLSETIRRLIDWASVFFFFLVCPFFVCSVPAIYIHCTFH